MEYISSAGLVEVTALHNAAGFDSQTKQNMQILHYNLA